MQPMPPCPAPTCWWQMQVSGLLLHWQLQLGAYSVGFFFLSQLCCPQRFQNSPQTCLWESFLLFENFSFMLPPQDRSPSLTLVLLFVLYILSYLLSKRMGCLSGCLVSSASIRKLFCESCSAFKWSFGEFVGEKVASPFYSSTILGPLPTSVVFLNDF